MIIRIYQKGQWAFHLNAHKNRLQSGLKGLAGHVPAGWNTFEAQYRTGLEVDLP